MLATRDIGAGEAVAQVPEELIVQLGTARMSGPVRSVFPTLRLATVMALPGACSRQSRELKASPRARSRLRAACMHAQENAAVLLGRLAQEPALQAELAPYWASLPAPNTSVFCKALFTERHADMLQSPIMVRQARARMRMHRALPSGFSVSIMWLQVRGGTP